MTAGGDPAPDPTIVDEVERSAAACAQAVAALPPAERARRCEVLGVRIVERLLEQGVQYDTAVAVAAAVAVDIEEAASLIDAPAGSA